MRHDRKSWILHDLDRCPMKGQMALSLPAIGRQSQLRAVAEVYAKKGHEEKFVTSSRLDQGDER
jgi:hypothetical protein